MRLFNRFLILVFVLSLVACSGGGDDTPASSNKAVWDNSNWDEKNWQ